MRKKVWLFVLISAIALLAACTNNDEESGTDEIKMLEVEFAVPETADVGETVELKAIVTYGGEQVKDADKVEFEYWEKGNEDSSTKLKATNNGDGTYTADVSFDHKGVYEMYAHTTAKDLHTMPKKSITVGDAKAGE
ncbi:hypothetical protein CFK37_18750 [Virgibacillus phasianinus]|uniref:YtkA-like domain-containing protein n=1 Tax=Virgibacillus phasianinus TaxID=2017483 RepID=A0A220U7D1_9BACI|nr:FixH family protein [Virgibacillus phasianinus]ASK64049.1 hypothetical protein CFK37_18750 [Virgibacillus phasianinus]